MTFFLSLHSPSSHPIDLSSYVYPFWFSQVGVLEMICACVLPVYTAKTIIMLIIHVTIRIVFRTCRCQNVYKDWKLKSLFKFKKLC